MPRFWLSCLELLLPAAVASGASAPFTSQGGTASNDLAKAAGSIPSKDLAEAAASLNTLPSHVATASGTIGSNTSGDVRSGKGRLFQNTVQQPTSAPLATEDASGERPHTSEMAATKTQTLKDASGAAVAANAVQPSGGDVTSQIGTDTDIAPGATAATDTGRSSDGPIAGDSATHAGNIGQVGADSAAQAGASGTDVMANAGHPSAGQFAADSVTDTAGTAQVSADSAEQAIASGSGVTANAGQSSIGQSVVDSATNAGGTAPVNAATAAQANTSGVGQISAGVASALTGSAQSNAGNAAPAGISGAAAIHTSRTAAPGTSIRAHTSTTTVQPWVDEENRGSMPLVIAEWALVVVICVAAGLVVLLSLWIVVKQWDLVTHAVLCFRLLPFHYDKSQAGQQEDDAQFNRLDDPYVYRPVDQYGNSRQDAPSHDDESPQQKEQKARLVAELLVLCGMPVFGFVAAAVSSVIVGSERVPLFTPLLILPMLYRAKRAEVGLCKSLTTNEDDKAFHGICHFVNFLIWINGAFYGMSIADACLLDQKLQEQFVEDWSGGALVLIWIAHHIHLKGMMAIDLAIVISLNLSWGIEFAKPLPSITAKIAGFERLADMYMGEWMRTDPNYHADEEDNRIGWRSLAFGVLRVMFGWIPQMFLQTSLIMAFGRGLDPLRGLPVTLISIIISWVATLAAVFDMNAALNKMTDKSAKVVGMPIVLISLVCAGLIVARLVMTEQCPDHAWGLTIGCIKDVKDV